MQKSTLSGATTFCIMTLSITTFSIFTQLKASSITTISITLKQCDNQHNDSRYWVKFVLVSIILNVVVLSAIMLRVVMLSAIMLNVTILSVLALKNHWKRSNGRWTYLDVTVPSCWHFTKSLKHAIFGSFSTQKTVFLWLDKVASWLNDLAPWLKANFKNTGCCQVWKK